MLEPHTHQKRVCPPDTPVHDNQPVIIVSMKRLQKMAAKVHVQVFDPDRFKITVLDANKRLSK